MLFLFIGVYGDIDGPWCSEPDDFYRKQPLVSRQDVWPAVGRTTTSEVPAEHNRSRFYLYCRQHGLWPYQVTGHDPHTQPKWFDRYCPIRNITKAYPPTLLIHGGYRRGLFRIQDEGREAS